jgi:hypothetical protein
MNCIFPPELTDLQLLAYLDDPDSNEGTARHLEQCPHCRERVKALASFQQGLKTRLYRSTCPSPLELGEYHLQMSSAAQRLAIAQHLRECPFCTQEIAELGMFLGEIGSRAGILEPVKILIAQLVGGAQTNPAPGLSALRGEIKGPLVFAADGIVITLDVQSGLNGHVSIQGQVAADDQDQWTGAVVRMQQADNLKWDASLDDMGAFGFEEVPPGSINLKITSPNGTEIQILNIDITI